MVTPSKKATADVGRIDPKKARQLIKEYFAEVTDQELYDDLMEYAPELIDHFGIHDSRQK